MIIIKKEIVMSKNLNFPAAKMITVNDIELEVFEAGQENKGSPIVLCHGWPELAYSWRHQIPALVEAGFHVIAPNQRGFGNSTCPKEVTSYDIKHLTDDLVGLLDHYGYRNATFIGHDWGSAVVWGMGLLHPNRVKKQINLALPYQERGETPWIQMMEKFLGEDYYFVHFNKKPGIADKVLDQNTKQFLNNLFRKNIPLAPQEVGMMMINLANSNEAKGEPILSERDVEVYLKAFKSSGFTPGINWYRNLDRNWHILGSANPIINHPCLMIYGEQDLIPKFNRIDQFVPNVTVASIDCGHWIQQELPDETNRVILEWLSS
jgi:pimeloyl-ACP methyl ester carboxylesterase